MAGRRPKGTALLDSLPGSDRAKKRVALYIDTMGAKVSVVDASQELEISETAFYEGRRDFLARCVSLAEPRPAGRKPREKSEAEIRVAALESELREVKAELQTQQVREELALALPRLVRKGRRRKAAEKKTARRTSE